ncbi:MAG: glycosyltransferase [Verrucomicrobia bacterium]|nr:MAG: glycosyltransferase [Verrucomicrobiota bacterium]
MHLVLDPRRKHSLAPRLCALGIMTKAPRAGTVKTRLQPPLTAEEAAQLNVCCLRDISAAIVRAGGESKGVAVFTPLGSEGDYVDVLPSDFDLIPQRGDSFGERLMNAASDLLRVGFESCCLINSDSPTMTASALREAVAKLQSADNHIVLGPSDDGGYYLIGMRKAYRRLFEDIDWSTERVFTQTLERARELTLRVDVLPEFYDIDDARALRRLCSELLDENSDDVAPATREFLAELVARDGRERFCPPWLSS